MTAEALDIYAVLGVRPDAPPALAREMYWSKMAPVLAGDRRQASTDASIDALNEALAIILDADLRAAYDAERRTYERQSELLEPPVVVEPLAERPRRSRQVASIIGAGAVVGVVLWLTAGLGAVLVQVAVCGLLIAVLLRRPRAVDERSAFDVLHLLPGAEPDHIDIAYRARAQQLLLIVRHQPAAIRELDALDGAYLEAMAITLGLTQTPEPAVAGPVEPRGPGRLATFASGMATAATGTFHAAYQGALRGTSSLAGSTAAVAGRTAEAAGKAAAGARANWEQRAASQRERRETQAAELAALQETQRAAALRAIEDPEEAPVDARLTLHRTDGTAAAVVIDLERRISGGLLTNAVQIAAAAPGSMAPIEAPVEPTPLRREMFMLLQSPAGTRRVPIDLRPIRIGSSSECDLVLPAREGVAPEHVLVWRHGPTLILHVTAPYAECLVNGEPVAWATLEDGDSVQIGGIVIAIEGGAE